jgi:hypothetical protein
MNHLNREVLRFDRELFSQTYPHPPPHPTPD